MTHAVRTSQPRFEAGRGGFLMAVQLEIKRTIDAGGF